MKAYEGLRVVDLSESIAGQFTARMFADHGADVVLVEPAGGSVVRDAWPRPAEGDSYLFQNLNRGKRAIASDEAALTELLDIADVVIAPPGFEAPDDRRWMLLTVSDFGGDGPLAGWKGGELIHQALSGVMYETGKVRGNPLYGCANRASMAGGVVGYISVVAQLLALRRGQSGDDAEVQVAETAATMNYCRATQYEYSGMVDRRGGTKRPMAFVKAADAWLCIFPDARRWKAVCEELGARELLEDPGLQTPVQRIVRWKDIIDVFETKVADRTAEELVGALQAIGGVSSRNYTPLELLAAPQLEARGFWRTTEDGRRTVGPMFRFSGNSEPTYRRAPERSGDVAA